MPTTRLIGQALYDLLELGVVAKLEGKHHSSFTPELKQKYLEKLNLNYNPSNTELDDSDKPKPRQTTIFDSFRQKSLQIVHNNNDLPEEYIVSLDNMQE